MTRKTTAYARKLRRTGDRATFNGAAWLNTIERCRPYSTEQVPGSWLAPNIGAAVKMDIKIHDALQRLLDHKTAADNTEDHDLMAAGQQPRSAQPGDAGADDRDSHL